MEEILDQLFSSFGTIGLIIAALFAGLVWALAHFSAQPGTAVSVLWGLVSYTKPERHIEPVDARSKVSRSHALSKKKGWVSADFTKGASMEVIDETSEEVPNGTKYIRLNRDWIDGVNSALDAYTSVQKTERLEKLVGGARAIIEGQVSDVDYHSMKVGEWIIMIADVDEDTRKIIQSFHIGDRIRLHAEVITPHLSVLKNPNFIQRVAGH